MEDCRDLKEQIEELIWKGKLQKFVKKDAFGQHKHDTRARSKEKPRNEDHSQDHSRSAIGEIRMFNGGPTIGG